MFNIFNILYQIAYPINYFLQFLGRLFSYVPGGKRLGNLSRAAKVAWLVWLPVVIFVTTMLVIDWWWKLEEESWATESLLNFILTIVLCFILPFVVYWMVRLIDTDKIHILPVIDEPWQAGIAELEQLGIDPKLTPFFLVLGTDEFEKSKDFHHKCFFKMEINGLPNGESFALHWYGGTEAVFLHPKFACRSSHTVKMYRGAGGGNPVAGKPQITEFARTLDGDDSVDGSFYTEDIDSGTFSDATEEFDANDSGFGDSYAGTLGGDEELYAEDVESNDRPAKPTAPNRDDSLNESSLAERVEYLSSLIKKIRGEEVPVDGVILFAPCSVVESHPDQLATSFHDDLSHFRDELGANFPVTVIISEMQEAEGFANLVNELGSKRAHISRFGKGFVIENLPSSEDMKLLSVAACESFQQHIYKTYSTKPLSSQKENQKLFHLLSRVNTKLRGSLDIFLHRMSLVPDGIDARDYHSITGCYFAATGRKESELAFVNGVVKKAIENCECTKWTNDSVRRDRLYKGMAGVFSLLAFVCFLGLVYKIYGLIVP